MPGAEFNLQSIFQFNNANKKQKRNFRVKTIKR